MQQRYLMVLALAASSTAAADNEFSMLIGNAWTNPGNVHMEGAGNELVFDGVEWDTRPEDPPPYYALRFTHWLDRKPQWGWSIDFLHAKMISNPDQILPVHGTVDGVAIDQDTRLGDQFSHLEFSDGHNLLTFNAMRRWAPLGHVETHWLQATSFYLGGGIGVAVPHVEVGFSGLDTVGYQLAGPAAQAMAGVSIPLGDRWSLNGEYRFTWADINADLDDGWTLGTEATTHHLNIGIGFRFGNQAN